VATQVHVPPDDVTEATGRGRESSPLRTIVEWTLVIAVAVGVALLIKGFVMQAFFIPSASMTPTLLEGDRVLVNKLSYRLHDVNRGDVIVFEKDPETSAIDPTKDLIKRVIGLPGENLAIEGGNVYINGQQLQEPYLQPNVTTSQGTTPCTLDKPCTVPNESVFVMGDNRPNSKDSRYIGAIPEDKIVGRAFVKVWPPNRLGGL
jgi:signal peptidase I